jgi:hypothetical protein
MRALRTWRGTSAALLVLWVVALLTPHAWRTVAARLGPAVPRAGPLIRTRAGAPAAERRDARPVPDEAGALDHARATTFAAGSNLKRDGAGAGWTFLLPSLELGLALSIGTPSAATLRTLSRLADEVVVVCHGAGDRRRLQRRSARIGATNVRSVQRELLTAEPLQPDLAVLADPLPRKFGYELRGALTSARAVFLDGADARAEHALAAELNGACVLRARPAGGELRTAAAERDSTTLAYLDDVASEQRLPRRHCSDGRRRAEARGRRAMLAFPTAREAQLDTPAYVRTIAQVAGLDLAEYRVGLLAPSEYASRKAILFLFRGEESSPELVVKLTRDAAHNSRLENEWRALRLLEQTGPPGSGLVPRPAFFGHHAGLAVLGESAVAGRPLRRCTSGRADCASAGAAMRWLGELGAASAHPATPDLDLPGALHDLLTRFELLYRLGEVQRQRLRTHVEAVADAAGALPLVTQHGDPGTWNVLIADDGRPVFLDWEAAERHGMPLWDLFYFARSFAIRVAGASGGGGSFRALRSELLGDGPVNRLLAAAVERHCAQIGVDGDLVEPLYTTCWMHRALKEATRLQASKLQRGHYFKLLELSLSSPDAPGLRRLAAAARAPAFSPSPAG